MEAMNSEDKYRGYIKVFVGFIKGKSKIIKQDEHLNDKSETIGSGVLWFWTAFFRNLII